MVRVLSIFALAAIALALAGSADGQLRRHVFQPAPVFVYPQACLPGQPCYVAPALAIPQAVEQAAMLPLPDGQEVTADGWYSILVGPRGRTLSASEKALAAQWAMRAARTYQGNGCGTSNLVGRDSSGTYWMTNAHVAGTKIGAPCRLQVVENGAIRTFNALVIEAAYSSRTRTDWALLRGPVDVLPNVHPIQMSKTKPHADKVTVTWGCPRCEPIKGQILETVQMGSVWYWQPNSIGGQSGSAVIQEGIQHGLLTWTENGNGSGQFTATIWAQSQAQNTDGPARTGFEIPVGVSNPNKVELTEGYHREDRETGLGEYPIWTDGAVEPPPGDDPPAGTWKVEQVIRNANQFDAVSGLVLRSTGPNGDQVIVTGNALAGLGLVEKYQVGDVLSFGKGVAPAPNAEDAANAAAEAADPDLRNLFSKLRQLRQEQADWQKWLPIILMILEILLKK